MDPAENTKTPSHKALVGKKEVVAGNLSLSICPMITKTCSVTMGTSQIVILPGESAFSRRV